MCDDRAASLSRPQPQSERMRQLPITTRASTVFANFAYRSEPCCSLDLSSHRCRFDRWLLAGRFRPQARLPAHLRPAFPMRLRLRRYRCRGWDISDSVTISHSLVWSRSACRSRRYNRIAAPPALVPDGEVAAEPPAPAEEAAPRAPPPAEPPAPPPLPPPLWAKATQGRG
jgi:hypothetical protein